MRWRIKNEVTRIYDSANLAEFNATRRGSVGEERSVIVNIADSDETWGLGAAAGLTLSSLLS